MHVLGKRLSIKWPLCMDTYYTSKQFWYKWSLLQQEQLYQTQNYCRLIETTAAI